MSVAFVEKLLQMTMLLWKEYSDGLAYLVVKGWIESFRPKNRASKHEALSKSINITMKACINMTTSSTQ